MPKPQETIGEITELVVKKKPRIKRSSADVTALKLRFEYYLDLTVRMSGIIEIHNLRRIFQYQDTNPIYEEIKTINTMINKHIGVVSGAAITSRKANELTVVLQSINDLFAKMFATYGAPTIKDIGLVCIGSSFDETIPPSPQVRDLYAIITTHAQPIKYNILEWPEDMVQNPKPNFIAKRLLVDDLCLMKTSPMLECFDLSRSEENLFLRVNGVKIIIHMAEKRQTMVLYAIIEDIPLTTLMRSTGGNYARFGEDIEEINTLHRADKEFDGTARQTKSFDIFMESLTIKQLVVYSPEDIYQKFKYMMYQSKIIYGEPLTKVANDFVNADIYTQRGKLITMIVGSDTQEHQYVINLLYELLSMGHNGSGPSPDQVELLASFPWSIRCYFSLITVRSNEATESIAAEFDTKKIPYEQRICLLKTTDAVKAKAMAKLKEVRSKNEDTGSKARLYLDGLLDIPFGEYKNEEILAVSKTCVETFGKLAALLAEHDVGVRIPLQDHYTSMDANRHVAMVKAHIGAGKTNQIDALKRGCLKGQTTKTALQRVLDDMAVAYQTFGEDVGVDIGYTKKMTKAELNARIVGVFDGCCNEPGLLVHFLEFFKIAAMDTNDTNDTTATNDDPSTHILEKVDGLVNDIECGYAEISEYMKRVRATLDKSVVGHDKAKRQIERVIAQWMNGDNGGYVFGFEGPPGLGKTSLAKYGISKCLVDANGESRPFAFIGVGGSSNGSTFEGHNYTYVGATWGRIVSILMESKVSNPIIFIDEIDKVSRTEHGREIIGILTHLIDPTQNVAFHDKYFNGVDIDLSKVLFVFSYNDVQCLDKVLLDRIHRIRFSALDEDEKVKIVREQMLPETLARFGLVGSIDIPDTVVRFLIQEYTCEAGVRKLKELIYEIVAEINLNVLERIKSTNVHANERTNVHANERTNGTDGVYTVTQEIIKTDLFKEKHGVREKMINTEPAVGVINGMWANAMGQGGVLPIEAHEFPSAAPMELKLTGMQGDVMKESMNVAKTLAWSLMTTAEQTACMKRMNGKVLKSGLHIHCPDGAVPKDGPSAGTAITVVMYSLMLGKRIKNALSITGEMCLQGKVTAIGGLDLKILGAARAGVKEVLFPVENQRDFDDFMEKYSDMPGVKDITFHPVETIAEVLKLVFV